MNQPDFWETNLAVLHKKYPPLAAKLEADRAGGDPENALHAEIIAAASGEPTLKVGGVLLHSGRDPVREARRLAEAALAPSVVPDIKLPVVPDTKPSAVPDTKLPAVPDTVPSAVPDTKLPVVPDTKRPAVPDTKLPAVPDIKLPAVPDIKPSAVPDTKPSAVPDTKLPVVPDTVLPAVPDTKPSAVPDTKLPAVPDTKLPAVPDIKLPAVPDTKLPAVQDTKLPAPAKDGAVIILGFGLGYAAEEAAKLAADALILIVEKRIKLFCIALETRDLSAFFERSRLAFILGGDASAVNAGLSLAGGAGIRAVLRNRNSLALDPVWAAQTEQAIELWRNKEAVNAVTLRRFGKRWVRNLGANLTALRDMPGISCLAGKFDFPIFVLAAGPSLDEIRPFLPAIHERCLIVCVDTALRFIERAGLSPDFTVCIDPQYWNTRHLDRAALGKTCLISESSVYPTALRMAAGKIFLCSSFFPLGRFIEERTGVKGALGAGGSVATSAWDFAFLLLAHHARSAQPTSSAPHAPSAPPELPAPPAPPADAGAIWIAGLDLSFPQQKTHFKGALFEERALSMQNRFAPAETASFHALRDGYPFYAPSANGGVVLTDKRLSLYASWFSNRAGVSAAGMGEKMRNYTLSGNGLKLEGFEPAAIEALLALPPRRAAIDRRLHEVLSENAALWDNTCEKQKRAEQFDRAKQSLLSGLAELRDSAAAAQRSAEESDGSPDLLSRLEEANTKIARSAVRDIAGFLMPRFEDLEADLQTPPEKPVERHLELSAKLYREIRENAEWTLRAMLRDNG
ncbi:MAG: DUF115 domain-containing protein [Spirochaetaceae bacterium]|nr:DUF115 domain-containing protein [Spirochaetaceae bacterium]